MFCASRILLNLTVIKCRLGLIKWLLWPSFAQPVLFVLSFVDWNVFYFCVLTAQTWLDLTLPLTCLSLCNTQARAVNLIHAVLCDDEAGLPYWLFKPKTTNLAFFESVWLANFLLAFWLFYHRKFEIWICPFCNFHCFRNTTLWILKPGNPTKLKTSDCDGVAIKESSFYV